MDDIKGYWASAKMMTETAVAMTQNRMAFPEAGQQGGVLTPVVGMGQALVDRLETCGDFRFIVE